MPSTPTEFADPFAGQTPRPEHPRPQFERADWLCLNGVWQFEIDQGNTGLSRKLHQSEQMRRLRRRAKIWPGSEMKVRYLSDRCEGM